MQLEELAKLIENIKRQKAETNNIELKAAYKGCPEKLYDTLSSFSNQDSGGIIIFGIDEKNGYYLCGVYNIDDLIKKVTEQCRQMEPPIRALFTVIEINGKNIVSAEIPSIDYLQRPCYYKGLGKYKGSFIRVGESDEVMTEYEIYSYESYKKRIKDDIRTIDSLDIKLFDNNKYQTYLHNIKDERENLSKNISNEKINELMGLSVDGKSTLASVLVFSKYPQAYFPQFSIIATCIPTIDKGMEYEQDIRFTDNKRITGPIDEMLEESISFVKKNIKTNIIIDDSGRRKDQYEYPIKAIREILLNALVHRDYSRFTEGTPISLEIYPNRIEITNPGSLYGGISVNELGYIRPETRNIILSNILEVLHVSENRYSGIPTIKSELISRNMPLPIFISRYGEFKVIIRNSFEGKNNIFEKVMIFCKTPRTRGEISEFLKLSRNHTISKIIMPLVEKGKLFLTIPDKPRSSFQKYYSKE